jgi:hypothetical protein
MRSYPKIVIIADESLSEPPIKKALHATAFPKVREPMLDMAILQKR